MVENDTATEGRIRTYLADHGGSVEDPGGRGLTDEMAREIGLDRPATLSALLGQMESDGLITREMRGLRTYRIALTGTADKPAAGEPASAAPPTAPEGPTGDNGSSGQPQTTSISLRQALARRPANQEPATAELPVAPNTVTTEPPASEQPSAAGAVSLRDALGRPGGMRESVPLAPERPAPRRVYGARPTQEPASAAPAAFAAPAPPPPPGRVFGPRPMGSGPDSDTAEQTASATTPPGATSRFASGGVTAPFPPVPAPPEADGNASTQATQAARAASEPSGSGRSSRMFNLAPPVKAPPSSAMVTAVTAALAGLVLIAVILVVIAKGSSHTVTLDQGAPVATDACNVVTTDMATQLFGASAGPPHFVLGSCVYDNGTKELIVEVYRQNARTVFDSGRTSSAQSIPGLGDEAYYADGRLRVLKGTSLLEIALGPSPATTAGSGVLSLAATAVGRL